MKKIIYVCTGNTCRSPIAEGYTKSKLKDKIEIVSRGISVYGNMGINEKAEIVLEEIGGELKNHTSRLLENWKVNI